MVQTTVLTGTMLTSFERHLRATNRAPKTVTLYLSAIRSFWTYLDTLGYPRDIAAVSREHVEL
ncbi:MAG TPA: hypothetical protein VFV93_14225, partial [Thermomicrobiales bacterium]|nr:hypothetical protein [Thermomicrobiales bacterium]